MRFVGEEREQNIYRALKFLLFFFVALLIQAISELHGDWRNKAP